MICPECKGRGYIDGKDDVSIWTCPTCHGIGTIPEVSAQPEQPFRASESNSGVEGHAGKSESIGPCTDLSELAVSEKPVAPTAPCHSNPVTEPDSGNQAPSVAPDSCLICKGDGKYRQTQWDKEGYPQELLKCPYCKGTGKEANPKSSPDAPVALREAVDLLQLLAIYFHFDYPKPLYKPILEKVHTFLARHKEGM